MRAPIAKIRISAGNPGWYDPLTNIHLTITRPTAFVYEGQNVTNIKNAVSFKLVQVVEGELEPVAKEVPVSNTVVREVIKKEQPKIEAVAEVIAEVEEVKETKVEEVVAEAKKPAKKTTKKKTTKKSEVTE